MKNFDALAVTLIAIVLLAFSEIHLTPKPAFGQAIRLQQTVLREQVRTQLRNHIQVLKCLNR